MSLDIELFDDMYEDPLSLVPSGLRHLIPGFIERRESEIRDLAGLLKLKDFVSIAGIAHRLKGSGAGYGFEEITNIGREMEAAAKTNDVATIDQLVGQLTTLITILKMRSDK